MSKNFSAWGSVVLFAISVFFFSCVAGRKTAVVDGNTIRVDYKSPRVLTAHLKENEFKFDWISAKFSAETNVDSSNNSFTVSMRIRKDSAIWMSVSKLGIEGARVLITKDSVKIIDRINSDYFAGDYSYFNKLLHAELDFDILQSLMVGNSVDFYDDDDRLKSFVENHKYVLSTIRRRKLKKVMSKNMELKDPIQIIWLEPVSYKISKILFEEFNVNKRTFEIIFSQFQKTDSCYFPHQVHFNVKAEKNVSVSIEYSKVSINMPQTFPFSIPEKYERIVYK